MLASIAFLAAVALASGESGRAVEAPEDWAEAAGDAASEEPASDIDPGYSKTVVSVLLARRAEWSSDADRERLIDVKLAIDSYLSDLPLTFTVLAEAGPNGALAEFGMKVLLPAIGPVRAYAGAFGGGALRSEAAFASFSAAAGVNLTVGRRFVLALEIEARELVWGDVEEEQYRRYQTAALAGVAFVFE